MAAQASPVMKWPQLEFLFIDALDHSEHGIPNLESQIAQSPARIRPGSGARLQAEATKEKTRRNGDRESRAAGGSRDWQLIGFSTKSKMIPGADETENRRVCAQPHGWPRSGVCAANMPAPILVITASVNCSPRRRRARTAYGPAKQSARQWKGSHPRKSAWILYRRS